MRITVVDTCVAVYRAGWCGLVDHNFHTAAGILVVTAAVSKRPVCGAARYIGKGLTEFEGGKSLTLDAGTFSGRAMWIAVVDAVVAADRADRVSFADDDINAAASIIVIACFIDETPKRCAAGIIGEGVAQGKAYQCFTFHTRG